MNQVNLHTIFCVKKQGSGFDFKGEQHEVKPKVKETAFQVSGIYDDL